MLVRSINLEREAKKSFFKENKLNEETSYFNMFKNVLPLNGYEQDQDEMYLGGQQENQTSIIQKITGK